MSPQDEWLYDKLESMREESTEQHQRLRSDMNAGFDAIRHEFRENVKELGGVRDRVLKIEVQREEESKAIIRRQWGISLLLSVGTWLLSQLWGQK